MNYRIRFHPLIARDFDTIAHWILHYAGPGAAAGKLAKLEAAIATLKATPRNSSLLNEIALSPRAISNGEAIYSITPR